MNYNKTKIKDLETQVGETLTLSYDYVDKAISLIEELAGSFQQGPNENTWSTLADLLEGVEWILTTMEEIDSIKDLEKIVNDYTIWNEYVKEVKELMEIIKDIEGPLKDEDNKTIGDILMDKVVASFKNMKSKLEFIKPEDGNMDVN